jgi:hypothetical protein
VYVVVGVDNLWGVTFLQIPATAPEKELLVTVKHTSIGNPKRKV